MGWPLILSVEGRRWRDCWLSPSCWKGPKPPPAIETDMWRRGPAATLAFSGRESFGTLLLAAGLAWLPAWSIALAGWSENLEPAPWFGVGGTLAGWALARM